MLHRGFLLWSLLVRMVNMYYRGIRMEKFGKIIILLVFI